MFGTNGLSAVEAAEYTCPVSETTALCTVDVNCKYCFYKTSFARSMSPESLPTKHSLVIVSIEYSSVRCMKPGFMCSFISWRGYRLSAMVPGLLIAKSWILILLRPSQDETPQRR